MPPKEPKPPADALAPSGDTLALPTEEALAAIGGPAQLPAEAAPSAPAPERKTPAAWAAQLGHTKPADSRLPEMQRIPFVLPAHAVADKLYGWSERAYHFQAPEDAFLITLATYTAALKSAMQFPATELVVDALTPEAAVRLNDFKPARNLKVERAAAAAKAAEATTPTETA